MSRTSPASTLGRRGATSTPRSTTATGGRACLGPSRASSRWLRSRSDAADDAERSPHVGAVLRWPDAPAGERRRCGLGPGGRDGQASPAAHARAERARPSARARSPLLERDRRARGPGGRHPRRRRDLRLAGDERRLAYAHPLSPAHGPLGPGRLPPPVFGAGTTTSRSIRSLWASTNHSIWSSPLVALTPARVPTTTQTNLCTMVRLRDRDPAPEAVTYVRLVSISPCTPPLVCRTTDSASFLSRTVLGSRTPRAVITESGSSTGWSVDSRRRPIAAS